MGHMRKFLWCCTNTQKYRNTQIPKNFEWSKSVHRFMHSATSGPHWYQIWHVLGPCPSKNYWQFSSTILIQFSCNSHAIIDEIFRNAPAILTCNSHPILTRQFSPAILTCNSHPCNSHPIFTWQFSSNFHLTILIQFSPDNSLPILTYNSHSILINTAQSVLTNNAQPIFS